MDIDVSYGPSFGLMAGAEAVAPPGLGSLRARSQGLRPGLMNFAPSGLVCDARDRGLALGSRSTWGRVLHGVRSTWGRVLHGARSAWGAFCTGRVLHRVFCTGCGPGAAACCGIGADERWVGLMVRSGRGFVVLGEHAAAHIAAAAQARAPVPTRTLPTRVVPTS